MAIYNNILYPTDLSEDNAKMNQKITSLVQEFNASLTLIHVIEPIPAYGYPGAGDMMSPFINEAKKAMARLGEKLNVPADKQIIQCDYGSIKTQVVTAATDMGIDLIIVGSHSRHGLAKLLGSNASAIIQASHCDVLTIRYEEAG